jgi:hypothetical protein
MKSTIITPDHAAIELPIPESYIGKKVEVTYTIEEVVADKTEVPSEPVRMKPSDFKGILSEETVKRFDEYLKHSRDDR